MLGTDPAKDVEIFHEADETFNTWVGRTRSRDYITISSESTLSSETRVLDASKPDGAFHVIQPRQKDMLYSIDHRGDKFYVQTNLNAKNFRLMETPVNKTTMDNWRSDPASPGCAAAGLYVV